MSDEFRRIFENTAALGLARLADKASSVFLSLFVARSLGAEGLGVYSASMVLFGLISLAAEMGSSTYLVREISKDRSRTSSYFLHLCALSAAASCVVMAAAALVVPHLGYSAALLGSAYVVICAVFPGTLRTLAEAVFVAHQRVAFVTYSTLGAAAVNVGATLLFLHHGYGVISLVAAFAGLQTALALCHVFFIHRVIARLEWAFDSNFAIRLLREVRVFAGSSLLAGFSARPEILLLSVLKSDAQIGAYSAALRVVDVWQTLPETYMKNVFPVLSHSALARHGATTRPVLDRSIKYLMAASLPLAAGSFAAARPVIELLYGSGFDSSVTALRILAWYIPLSFLHELLWRVLAARNDQRLMFRAQVITVLLRLAAGCALISWLGSTGAALTATLAVLEHVVLLSYFVRLDGTRMRILRLSWRSAMAALGMALLTAFLAERVGIWTTVLTSAVCFGLLILLTEVLVSDRRFSIRVVLVKFCKFSGSDVPPSC